MELHTPAMKKSAKELWTLGYGLDKKVISLAFLTSLPNSYFFCISFTTLDEDLLKNLSKITATTLMEAKHC